MRLWKAGITLFGMLFLLMIPGSAQSEPPQVYGGGTFSPNQRVTLEYRLPNGGSNRIQVLRINNPDKLLELGGPRDFERTKELELSLVKTVSVFRARSNTWGNAQIGKLPEGFYVAQIGTPKPTSATLILVTSLGLVTKADPDTLVAYTANLQSGEPKESQVFVVKDKKVAYSARATGGLAQIRTQFKNRENLFVAARSGASWAFSDAYWQEWNLQNYRVYLTTDRPVYRPGQTVLFKGTLRKASGLQPLAGQTVEVVVQDTNEAEVYSGQVTTDAYGSFSAQFQSKLDARLGYYSLIARYKGEEHRNEFEIQEYVKPEYRVTATPDKTIHVQGEKARFVVKGEYLFGGPVSGGKVTYSVIRKPYYRFAYQSSYGFYTNYEYEDSYDGEMILQGEGRLNDKGELIIDVPLKPWDQDYRLSLEAGVSDEAGRQISGRANLTAYRSGIVLDIATTNYAYQVGETITAKVKAQDLEGKPVAVPFSVAIKRSYWIRSKGEQTDAVTTLQGRTDASGEALVKFKLTEQGSYSLEVSAKDSAGRPTDASDYLWVSDGSYWYWSYKSVDIKPDKPEYKVGETAKFVIQSPITDGWALINLEGNQLSQPDIVHFKGTTFSYSVKVTEGMAPNGYLAVTVLGNGQYYSDVAGFLIPPSEKFLNVAIASDKTTYKPGEEATYQIKVTDANGKPVQTQLTLGLVDEAIYLISPENTPDIRGFFWAYKENLVGTETAGSYYFGNVAPAPLVAAKADMNRAVFGQAKESAAKSSNLASATVRQDFRDTALWLPSVETDAAGNATVKTKLPDNLTQWRMTARAIDLSDKMGQNTQTITSTLPVIARLATPRFLVKGDQASFKVIGQNNLAEAQNGETRLSVSGLELLTQSPIQALFPAKGRTPTVYQVKASQTGTATLEASALTPAASDALRVNLPVLPKGLKQELGWAGQTGDRYTFDLPANADLTQAKATLYLNPSLATAVTPALAYLAGYPYGCSEQTMSRFLPSVLAKQAGGFVSLPPDVANNLDDYVAQGLKRLYDFQHEDGGWGFWQNDSSSLYISSYVITGLLQAKETGYEIREDAVKRGVEYLLKTLNRDEDFASDAVAYAGYAFAMAGPDYLPEGSRNGIYHAAAPRLFKAANQTKEPLDLSYLEEFLKAKDLTPYGHALIVLAYEKNGDKAAANRALDGLLQKLTQRDRVAYWETDDAYQWAWNDDRIEATARGLEALAKLRPDHPAIAKIANWLMLERKGNRWISTKDTAAVVVAALELAKVRGETAGEQQVNVKFNGQEQTVAVGPKGLEVPLQGLQVGPNNLEVSGNQPFFASAGVSYFEEKDYLNIESKGFRLGRQYEKLTPRYDAKTDTYSYVRSPLPQTLKVGDLVAVTLSVRPDAKNTRYVLLEEPLPAGLSVVENDDSFRIAGVKSRYGDDYYGWNYWFDGREIRDSRLEFYFSYLSGPVTFTYILRAETPGTFTALPSTAWMMYEPEVRGTGTVRTLQVTE